MMDAVSSELMDFALVAMNHAIDSVVSSGGPLVPFLLIENGLAEGRQLLRFPGDLEKGLHHARMKAKESIGVRRAAVAWDGYLTMDGVRTDAVFVEASEIGSFRSTILAQRYVADGGIEYLARRLGIVVFAGNGDPLY